MSEVNGTSKLNNLHHIVVLQHPQEKKHPLSSSPLLEKNLNKFTITHGLSWRNLKQILKKEELNPKEWMVLFLGTKKSLDSHKDSKFTVIDKNKKPMQIEPSSIKGLIVLDGNWKQSKTMWWRNAWLIKHPRIMLNPPTTSLYGKLRKEPRKESVSTLEAVAYFIEWFSVQPEISEKLRSDFIEFLNVQKPSLQQPQKQID